MIMMISICLKIEKRNVYKIFLLFFSEDLILGQDLYPHGFKRQLRPKPSQTPKLFYFYFLKLDGDEEDFSFALYSHSDSTSAV